MPCSFLEIVGLLCDRPAFTPPPRCIAHALTAEYLRLCEASAVVGSSLAIVGPDAALSVVSFGAQSVDGDGGSAVPASPDTVWHWASLTKLLTGIAVLQLRDGGRLALSDPVIAHIPEVAGVRCPHGPVEDITLWHLATHSAGFRAASWPW